MQLVKTTRDTLLRPLQIVSGIVERRHTMPILANILIRKDGESVSFLSTDTEVQITTHANIGSGDDVTGTTVAAPTPFFAATTSAMIESAISAGVLLPM